MHSLSIPPRKTHDSNGIRDFIKASVLRTQLEASYTHQVLPLSEFTSIHDPSPHYGRRIENTEKARSVWRGYKSTPLHLPSMRTTHTFQPDKPRRGSLLSFWGVLQASLEDSQNVLLHSISAL